MHKSQINISLVSDAVEKEYEVELSLFLKIKSLFVSSRVHSASLRKLSFLTGASVTVVRRCLLFYFEKGWCMRDGQDIIFKGMRHIDGEKSKFKKIYEVKVFKKDSYKTILKKIRLLLVRSTYDRFKYIQELSTHYTKPENLAQYKKALKAFRKGKLRNLISEGVRFCVSNRVIGKMMIRSKSTGSRLIKWARDKKLIKVIRNIAPAPGYNYLTPGCFVTHFGKLMIQKPNFIIF